MHLELPEPGEPASDNEVTPAEGTFVVAGGVSHQPVRKLLSDQASSIWGKSDRADGKEWLPLYVHMSDAGHSAETLWDVWVPEGIKRCIAQSFDHDISLARQVAVFLAAVHDIGKATPVFQCKTWGFGTGEDNENSLRWKPESVGLKILPGVEGRSRPVHPIAGQAILEGYMCASGFSDLFCESLGAVVGGHHGSAPTRDEIRSAKLANPVEMGDKQAYGSDSWENVQNELITFAESISELELQKLADKHLDYVMPQVASLLTGIVIMSDWIASNTDYFPLVPLVSRAFEDGGEAQEQAQVDPLLGISTPQELVLRAQTAWKQVDITPAWKEESNISGSAEALFAQRFYLPKGAHPHPIQSAAVQIAEDVADPGIVVIEAPMGEGKTEAALSVAEVLAQKTGRGGVCIALPTMATTDAMFDRAADWVNALPQQTGANEKSIYLAHGKAALNERFHGILSASRHQEESEFSIYDEAQYHQLTEATPEAIAADWFWGRKRGVLANFLVCTVDQVLMASLQMRHASLRQLAIANKVVIIDECHAYDVYMRQYLFRTLEWLGGMGAPVVLLSATMPETLRSQMVDSYLKGKDAKPTPRRTESLLAKLKAGKKALSGQGKVGLGDTSGQESSEDPDLTIDKEYPLITYSEGARVKRCSAPASSRKTAVNCSFLPDDMDSLLKLVADLTADGGCVGIMCDVVSRAQEVAAAMEEHFGADVVKLAHSRFIDIDRMSNEKELRTLLGPPSETDVSRPKKLIVVGTQVLEQSLDIDFDALITDVAPIDLLLQRMGRLHRHERGTRESERPAALRTAQCYIRGIEEWSEEGPVFARGIDYVYHHAALLEGLSVIKMTSSDAKRTVKLPSDIAPLVRTAYSAQVSGLVPQQWRDAYAEADQKRTQKKDSKHRKAETFLAQSLAGMVHNHRCIGQDVQVSLGSVSDEKGQMAVRDTEDSIEVLLLKKNGNGVRLLPWLSEGIPNDGELPIDVQPSEEVAKIAAQCAVRLPSWMSRGSFGDDVVDSLEKLSAPYVLQWRDSRWLGGKLIIPLDDDLSTFVNGWRVRYSREKGLFVEKVEDEQNEVSVF